MQVDVETIALFGLLVCAGALVQASVGFGLGVVVAPVVTILAPALMPESLLVVGLSLPFLMLWRRSGDLDTRGLLWALAGRAPGAVVGAYLVTIATSRQLGVVVACVVLATVLLTATSIDVVRTPATLFTAGSISGVTGTAAAIGGPPLALLYAGEPGARIRTTLAAYFLIGGCGSLFALGVAGELELESIIVGCTAVPFVALGHMLAKPIGTRLDAGLMKPAITILAVVSAIVLLIRSLT